MNFILLVSCKLLRRTNEHSFEEINEANDIVLDKPFMCKSSLYRYGSLIIAIKSTPVLQKQRNILRQTWLLDAVLQNIPYIFVMGSSVNQSINEELKKEDEKHNDLLIGKTIDYYYNLTLKIIFLLHWTNQRCSDHWLLYVDDDTIVNVKRVVDFIASAQNRSVNTIYCAICRLPVPRSVHSRWFVPSSVWKPAYFPEYCYGFGYLVPSNILYMLYDAAINGSVRPKLWIDDVFITGIVANKVGIKLSQTPFRWSHSYTIRDFNENLVLAEVGRNDHFFRRWLSIRGNFTPFIQSSTLFAILRKTSIRSTSKSFVFAIFQFLVQKCLGNTIHKLLFAYIICTIILVIFFYKMCRKRLRIF